MRTGQILAGGVRLVRDQPAAVAWWALLYFAVTAASLALVWPMMAELMTWQQNAMVAQTQGATTPMPPTGFFGGIMVMQLAFLVAMAAIFAAAVRAVARGGRDAFGFLRLGMDELRLIGLGLLLGVASFAASIVGVIVLVLVAVAVGMAVGEAGALIAVPLYLVLMAAYLWAGTRISLAGAYTVLRGRIVVREAWAATRGRFWSLFGAYVVILLGFAIASLVVVAISNPALLSFYAWMEPDDMAAALAAQQAIMADMLGPRMLAMTLVGGAINALLAAILFGAIATAAVGDGAQWKPMAA